MQLNDLILSNLLTHEKYARKIIPHIQSKYFEHEHEKIIFKTLYEYFEKYDEQPTKEVFIIEINNLNNLLEDTYKKCLDFIEHYFSNEENYNFEYLLEKTNEWLSDRAIYLALTESINIYEKKGNKNVIPDLMEEALSVSIDDDIGHDYFSDYEKRFEFYHKKEDKIEFPLKMMNRITNGGVSPKTLNMFLASTGVGKTSFMCNWAAHCIQKGYNVLYISMEMSEENISKRIDANLFDLSLHNIDNVRKDAFEGYISRLRSLYSGNLIVKEYPTSQANALHFKNLYKEILMKRGLKTNIIFVDYLNICNSYRIRSSENTYTLAKSIAEELRGLAVELEVPIISATQTNRNGIENSDITLSDTSESYGVPATLDFYCSLFSNEELANMNQVLVKQLKNRYNDLYKDTKFFIGLDRSKMKYYDIDEKSNQSNNSNESDKLTTEEPEFGFSRKTKKIENNEFVF